MLAIAHGVQRRNLAFTIRNAVLWTGEGLRRMEGGQWGGREAGGGACCARLMGVAGKPSFL